MELSDLSKALEANPEALAFVTSLATEAAKAKDLETKLTETTTQLTNVVAIKDDVIKQRDELKNKNKTTTENTVPLPDYNALVEQIKEFSTKVSTLETKATQAEQNEAKAVLDKVTGDLKSSVISNASSNKAINPAQVHILMQGEGLVGLKEGKPFYYTLNEKNEPVTATPEAAVKWYLERNKHLVGASGVVLPGAQHQGNGNNANSGPKNLKEAKAALINGGSFK